MAAKDIMNEHCYVAWSIFQPNGGFLRVSTLSRDCLLKENRSFSLSALI